jgi:hypothetical protein
MPVEQVASLLDRWRQADGMFARGRVLTEAVRLLRNLTPDERRTLARALAERGSPELAAQFEGSFGGSLEADKVRHIADQLLSMDDDELAAMIDDLRDPDQRRQLATDAVDRAFAMDGGPAVADGAPTSPPPGADTPPSGPPPPPGAPAPTGTDASDLDATDTDATATDAADTDAATSELDAAAAAARETVEQQRARLQELADADGDLELEDLTLGRQALGDQQLGAVALGGVALGSADLVEADLVDVGLGPGDAVAPAPNGPPGDVDATDRDPTDHEPTEHDPTEHDPTDQGRPDVRDQDDVRDDDQLTDAPTLAPVAVGSPGDAGRELSSQLDDVTDPADAVCRTLLDRLGTTDQALPRLKLLDDVRLDDLHATAALRVLDAYPDGWQRRRAAVRLLDAGALQGVAAGDLVHCFARTGDAAFVAGGLVDVGHLDAATLDGLLPDATVSRLRRRQER